MSQSFGIVEEKLREADFFLEELQGSSRLSFEGRCYFSAFVSAARSVTLALQGTMDGIPDFDQWYKGTQAKLKADALSRFFVEIRNDSVHRGLNPLDNVTLEHLREDLFQQMCQEMRSHVLVLPSAHSNGSTVLADAVEACSTYFASLVRLIFECYGRFKVVVDPQWYFTEDNFIAMGKTFEDAVAEMGFPPEWALCAPAGEARWRALRSQQPPCLINNLFHKYLGYQFESPDELKGEMDRGRR